MYHPTVRDPSGYCSFDKSLARGVGDQHFIAGNVAIGATDGQGTGAYFGSIRQICVGPDSAIYATDNSNHAIRRITMTG
jgi:hypothetical protein